MNGSLIAVQLLHCAIKSYQLKNATMVTMPPRREWAHIKNQSTVFLIDWWFPINGEGARIAPHNDNKFYNQAKCVRERKHQHINSPSFGFNWIGQHWVYRVCFLQFFYLVFRGSKGKIWGSDWDLGKFEERIEGIWKKIEVWGKLEGCLRYENLVNLEVYRNLGKFEGFNKKKT